MLNVAHNIDAVVKKILKFNRGVGGAYWVDVSRPLILSYVSSGFDEGALNNLSEKLLNYIFEVNSTYIVFIPIKIEGHYVLQITLDARIISYSSYMKNVPVEIPALIISKLKHFHAQDFIHILGKIYSSEFINAWKIIAGDMFYNPMTMQLTEHPLVINLFNEFVKLKYGNLGGANNDIQIFWTKQCINFFDGFVDAFGFVGNTRIRIDDIFNIYSSGGSKPRGNLYDKPWHGFNTIHSSGVIVNQSKLKIRLRELESKK